MPRLLDSKTGRLDRVILGLFTVWGLGFTVNNRDICGDDIGLYCDDTIGLYNDDTRCLPCTTSP